MVNTTVPDFAKPRFEEKPVKCDENGAPHLAESAIELLSKAPASLDPSDELIGLLEFPPKEGEKMGPSGFLVGRFHGVKLAVSGSGCKSLTSKALR